MGGIAQHPGARPGRGNAILMEPTSSQENGLKTRREVFHHHTCTGARLPRLFGAGVVGDRVHVEDCRQSDARSGAVLGGELCL